MTDRAGIGRRSGGDVDAEQDSAALPRAARHERLFDLIQGDPASVCSCSEGQSPVLVARKTGQGQNWGLERWPLRDEGRVLLRMLGRGLERWPLRDEGRELLQVLGQGLVRWLLRDDDRELLQVLGQGLVRWLLRDEGRVLLRMLGRGLERWLLRDEGRVLLRVLGQGPLRGPGLPELSGG